MTLANARVANYVVCPIDGTAAAPTISWGGGVLPNSGTGLYGSFGSISASLAGSLAFKVDANGIATTNSVYILNAAGAPTDTVTGAAVAEIGSLYIDITAGKLYINTGTKVSPTWTVVGTQS